MAISIPAYISYLPRIRLKEAAREIASDMQYAKVQAIKTNTTTAVLFSPGSRGYKVITDSGETSGTLTWSSGNETVKKTVALSSFEGVSFGGNTSDTRPGDTEDIDDGVTFTDNVVIFTNKATSVAGTVYIKNEKGDTMAVGSTSAAGRVKTWFNWGSGWEDR